MYQYRYRLPIYKRKNGSTVIEHADYYDENIFDYYITSASQGDVQLGFFNNDGTKFYPISDDYSGCRILPRRITDMYMIHQIL